MTLQFQNFISVWNKTKAKKTLMNYIKGKMQQSKNLESELGTAPVTTLSVVSDSVVSPHTDPVRNWPVLSHLLRQFLLDSEGLVWRLQRKNNNKSNEKTVTEFESHENRKLEIEDWEYHFRFTGMRSTAGTDWKP
jgi:hypothetical protein